jgi:uncharacterized membrane protein HdeD (DUF308 family)
VPNQIIEITLRQKTVAPHTLVETCSGQQMARPNLIICPIWLHQLNQIIEVRLRQKYVAPHTLSIVDMSVQTDILNLVIIYFFEEELFMFWRQKSWGFDWPLFLSGIIFLIAGLFLVAQPSASLVSIVLIFGIMAIVQGISWLGNFFHYRDYVNGISFFVIIAGVLDILIGIIFITKIYVGAIVIAYVFATWFLIDSIIGIVVASHLRNFGKGYFWVSLILDILGVVVAIMMLFNPLSSLLTMTMLLSIYFIIFGVNNVIMAIAHRG